MYRCWPPCLHWPLRILFRYWSLDSDGILDVSGQSHGAELYISSVENFDVLNQKLLSMWDVLGHLKWQEMPMGGQTESSTKV